MRSRSSSRRQRRGGSALPLIRSTAPATSTVRAPPRPSLRPASPGAAAGCCSCCGSGSGSRSGFCSGSWALRSSPPLPGPRPLTPRRLPAPRQRLDRHDLRRLGEEIRGPGHDRRHSSPRLRADLRGLLHVRLGDGVHPDGQVGRGVWQGCASLRARPLLRYAPRQSAAASLSQPHEHTSCGCIWLAQRGCALCAVRLAIRSTVWRF